MTYSSAGCAFLAAPHTAAVAVSHLTPPATHSFPIFGSGALSVSREAQLGAVLRKAVGCSRQGDVWLCLGELLQRLCGEGGAGTLGFPRGTQAQLSVVWLGGEGTLQPSAWHNELCRVVGTWEIMTRHWLLQRSFRTWEFAPRILESAWALLSPAAFTRVCTSGLWRWMLTGASPG